MKNEKKGGEIIDFMSIWLERRGGWNWWDLGIFSLDLLKCFPLELRIKLMRKPSQKIRTKKPPCIVQTMWKPPCNIVMFLFFFLFFPLVFFFWLSFLLLFCFILFYFYFLSFSTFLLRLLSFSGTFHSFDLLFFFFICFGFLFFGSSYFCFPQICYFYFYFYLIKIWE